MRRPRGRARSYVTGILLQLCVYVCAHAHLKKKIIGSDTLCHFYRIAIIPYRAAVPTVDGPRAGHCSSRSVPARLREIKRFIINYNRLLFLFVLVSFSWSDTRHGNALHVKGAVRVRHADDLRFTTEIKYTARVDDPEKRYVFERFVWIAISFFLPL